MKNLRHPGTIFFIIILLFAGSLLFGGQNPLIPFPSGPDITSRSAILIDYESGVILYEKNADIPIPPASLTKIVTLYTVLTEIKAQGMTLDSLVDIPTEAWSVNAPPQSSLMFLGPNQKVSLGEVIKGLIVASGNDAAIALAIHTLGSVDLFIERMNRQMRLLGFDSFIFADTSGYSSNNAINAKDFALFLCGFLDLWPETLEDYFSVKEITYPLAHNKRNGNTDQSITQKNRNQLLWEYPGADGFKTGYIGASGHNLAFTAQRDGRRLIGVVLSATGSSYAEENRNRFTDAAKLLDFGFDSFITLNLGHPDPSPVRVWKGKTKHVNLHSREDSVVTLPKILVPALTGNINQAAFTEAPVSSHTPLGEVVYKSGDTEILRLPLYPSEEIPRAGFFKVFTDSIRLFFLRITNPVYKKKQL